jgi:flavin reductase (DIM6/NTAB) family NADH-FMN oxidoreductase RutF
MKEIAVRDLTLNPMTLIDGQWWLLAAGNETTGFNAMTASWGHLGSIWERPGDQAHQALATAIIYVRPQRYTREFMDREALFTLSVFDENYKKALGYLGSHSGRNGDKVAVSGLTPVYAEGVTWFSQARMVFICRKLYRAPLQEAGFTDKSLAAANYPQKDFHIMYVGEILKVLVKE